MEGNVPWLFHIVLIQFPLSTFAKQRRLKSKFISVQNKYIILVKDTVSFVIQLFSISDINVSGPI